MKDGTDCWVFKMGPQGYKIAVYSFGEVIVFERIKRNCSEA